MLDKIIDKELWGRYTIKKPDVESTDRDITEKLTAYPLRDPIKYPNLTVEEHYFRRYIPNIFSNFFTELSFFYQTTQHNKCKNYELDALECFEYYGPKKGMETCGPYYEDFVECTNSVRQDMRLKAMSRQMRKRYVEYLRGERDYKDIYKPLPKPHAYHSPGFFPKDQI